MKKEAQKKHIVLTELLYIEVLSVDELMCGRKIRQAFVSNMWMMLSRSLQIRGSFMQCKL